MTSTGQYDQWKDQRELIVISRYCSALSPDAMADPNMPETVQRLVDQQLAAMAPPNGTRPPADGGLADLIGLGATAPADPGQTVMSPGVVDYDDTVASDRLLATADLYYQYVHERMGVFDVIFKLQELFRAGTLRISAGPGAFGLYRFDKHAILRYRSASGCRPTGGCSATARTRPGRDARPNPEFHGLFTHFIAETRQVLARQADQRGDPGTGDRPDVRLDRDRPAGRARPPQQRQELLVRLRQRDADRDQPGAGRGVRHPGAPTTSARSSVPRRPGTRSSW